VKFREEENRYHSPTRPPLQPFFHSPAAVGVIYLYYAEVRKGRAVAEGGGRQGDGGGLELVEYDTRTSSKEARRWREFEDRKLIIAATG